MAATSTGRWYLDQSWKGPIIDTHRLDHTLVGTLTFRGTDIPIQGSEFLFMADYDVPAGSWFDVNSNPVVVDYIGADITVVPLPPTAWLMTAGLSMLAGLARSRKT